MAMPVEIAGFAQSLARCMDFDTVEPPELEDVLTEATEALEMQFAEPSADSTLIRSGVAVYSPTFRSARYHRSTAVSLFRAGGSFPNWRARVPDGR